MDKRQEWGSRLSRFEARRCSVVEFCRREGVTPGSVYRWRRRLTPQFVEVSIPTQARLVVEVGGARIEVPEDFDPAHLRAVVAALR